MSDPLSAALAASPLCRSLDDTELSDLASRGRVERWSEGARIMEEGLGGPRLVILLEGEVRVSKLGTFDREHAIATIGPGGVLGEMALLRETRRTASATALSPLRVFAMDRRAFQAMLEEGSPAATKLLHALARVLAWRLAEASERMVGLMEASETGALREEVAQVQASLHAEWENTD